MASRKDAKKNTSVSRSAVSIAVYWIGCEEPIVRVAINHYRISKQNPPDWPLTFVYELALLSKDGVFIEGFPELLEGGCGFLKFQCTIRQVPCLTPLELEGQGR